MSLRYDSMADLPPAVRDQVAKKLGVQIREQKNRKYHNEPTVRGLLRFDSQKEARRYDQLMLMLRAGAITDLKLQPEFTLVEGFRDLDGKWHRAMKYRADFSYQKDGELVVEDVKSEATRQDKTYRAKAKLMRAVKGIEIKEV